jgi:hypothetical protein
MASQTTTSTSTTATTTTMADDDSIKQEVVFGPATREDTVPDEEETCPLFMTKLPDNIEENPDLLALQTALYESEDPKEVSPEIEHTQRQTDRQTDRVTETVILSTTKYEYDLLTCVD